MKKMNLKFPIRILRRRSVGRSVLQDTIRMISAKIALKNVLPLDLHIPNKKTIRILKNSSAGKNLERFDSVDELIASWEK